MVDLKELFHGLQEQMQTSLNVNRKFIGHPGSKGDATEQHWIEFLRTYLPDRYKVDKAIVIDSIGNVSEQMDVVIYDAIYTPFIFKQDNFMYIPAESVYAVFEVKQDVEGHIEYAAKKVESVRKLKRTSISMVASGRTTPARPLTKDNRWYFNYNKLVQGERYGNKAVREIERVTDIGFGMSL